MRAIATPPNTQKQAFMKATRISRTLRLACLLAAAGCLRQTTSQAQADFAMGELTLSPPLAAMSGGDYAMDAPVLGDGARSLQGGDYTLAVEMAALPPILSIGGASLFIVIAGGEAVVTWTPGLAGFVLESSASLGPAANWQAVIPEPEESRFAAPLGGGPRFFRLRRP